MPFRMTITDEAERPLRFLLVRDQRTLEAAILSRLEHQPTTPTKAIKRLHPNPLAEFELRAGDLPKFQALVAKSKASRRKPFSAGGAGPTNG